MADHDGVPACVGSNPCQWFSLDLGKIATCLEVCSACPVREACLAGAVERGEEYGVWGGRLFIDPVTARRVSRLQRRALARRRRLAVGRAA